MKKIKITKQFFNKGLTMQQIKNLNVEQGQKLKVINYTFALPNSGKVKTVKLEGEFIFVKINKYNTETDAILVIKNEITNESFSLFGENDFITGLEIVK